jgi:type VI protein secretion system component Hcp
VLSNDSDVKIIGYSFESQDPFEIATYSLPSSSDPEESHSSMEFVSFIDDCDPRLLIAVTYNEMTQRTAFRMMQI